MANTPTDDPTQARNARQYHHDKPLEDHVDRNTSDRTGHLEDQHLDLDARTLAMLGKRQRLNRNFGLVSMVAFATTLQQAWVSVALTWQEAMVSGGPANMLWGLVFCWLGSMGISASLAELSSMAPTAGAQYHWTAGLAPVRFATAFSWAAGWITVFARVSLCASVSFITAQLIEGLVILNNPAYQPAAWQDVLLYWAVLALTTAVNILGIRKFPHIETVAFIYFVALFFVFLVPLTYLTPQSSAQFVFADYENSSGWENDSVVWLIGLMNAAYTFVGIDGTSHMSEEVRKSSVVVPRSIMWSQIINGATAIAITIVILFGIGDIETALSTPTKYPILQILLQATGSPAATTVMGAMLVFALIFVILGIHASASRLTWAFARDKGLPFPNFFAHVNTSYMIPVRCITFVSVVAALIGLLNFGSSTVFHAFVSLALIGHYVSYLLPILLLLIRRFNKKEVPFGPWTLGRWGMVINLLTVAYLSLIVAFMVFPPYQPVTPKNLNYAGPIFGLSLLISLVFWVTYGRRVYHGPVQEVIYEKNIKP